MLKCAECSFSCKELKDLKSHIVKHGYEHDVNGWRRYRYAHHTKYREKIKKQTRERQKEKRGDPQVGRTIKYVDGKPCYSVASIAKKVGLSRKRLWELKNENIIPPTYYRDARGWFLYTEHQRRIINVAFQKYTKGGKRDYRAIQKFLWERWDDIEMEVYYGDKKEGATSGSN